MSERTAVHVLVTEIFLLFKDKQNIPAYMEKNYPSMGYVTSRKGSSCPMRHALRLYMLTIRQLCIR